MTDAADRASATRRIDRMFDTVADAPYRFDFFALLRHIEAADNRRPRLGRALRPRDEPLRVGQDPGLDFAPAAVSSFRRGSGHAPRLGQRFLGLFGPMGPLPLHLTEFARNRAHNHADATLIAFADQFHHRALLLFFRAWALAQPTVHLDRRDDDDFSRWLGSIAGIGDAPFLSRDNVSDDAKRYRAAILARGAKSAEGLTKLLRGYFAVPVRLESHVGHWLQMRTEDRTLLHPRTHARLRNALGVNAVAGAKVWDRQFRFRLHLGPLRYAQFRRFLPGQRSIRELRDWVRQYIGLGMSYDTVAWLHGHEIPTLRLGVRGDDVGRLGWTTWLGARGPHPARGDLRLNPETCRPAA
jgi:type VI secretion system protein ImpH